MKLSTWKGVVLGSLLGWGMGLSFLAKADTIGVHLGSYHWNNTEGYNNVNPGIYYERNNVVLGTYYNSERKQTVYAGYNFHYHLYGGLSGELTVGLATGYSRASVIPAAIPSLVYSFGNGLGIRLSVVPPVAGDIKAVAHVAVQYSF